MAPATVHLDGKTVTIGLNEAQLAVRGEGDLITAVILSVAPAPEPDIQS